MRQAALTNRGSNDEFMQVKLLIEILQRRYNEYGDTEVVILDVDRHTVKQVSNIVKLEPMDQEAASWGTKTVILQSI